MKPARAQASQKRGAYTVSETYIGEVPPGRRIKLIFVGAGLSGITFHYRAKDIPYLDYTIYEKNGDVAGTWYENRYPGAACDIPSQSYSFLFATNPSWSHFYSPAPEIRRYMQDTARSIGAYEKIKLGKKVVEAAWKGDAGKWHIRVEDTRTGATTEDSCDVLVNGGGVLNNWTWPDIPGLHSFRGKLMHTAKWDESYSVHDKRVAVIGSGSSAIQVVPALSPVVAHLTSFNRSKTYIVPGFVPQLTPDRDGRNFAFSEVEKTRMREDKAYCLSKRKELEELLLTGAAMRMRKGTKPQAAWQRAAVRMMKEQLGGDEELAKKLIPDFEVGCRRPTPGEGYLEALTRPNATVVTSPIERITEQGLVTVDGMEHVVDAIVCATGFDASFAPHWKIVGTDTSTTLGDEMRAMPRVYFGVSVPKYPNYYTIFGAFSPVAQGSYVPGSEVYIAYILQIVDKMAQENVKSVMVKEKAAADFVEHADAWLPRTVWSGSCSAWYKGRKDGKPVMYPGSYPHFLRFMQTPRYEHYEVEYLDGNGLCGNCLSWLGNGMVREEVDGGGELATFINPYVEAETREQVSGAVDVGVKAKL